MNKRCLAGLLAAATCAAGAHAAPLQVPFDRAYTVASAGSTVPVTEFDLDGPAPWIYLDLPSPRGQYSSGSASWFSGPAATPAFTLHGGALFASDEEFWLSPSPEVWQQAKAAGEWRINANYSWWTLVIIYGGGAPLANAVGSQAVTFTVVDAPYRVPGDADGDDRITITDYFRIDVGYSGRMTGWANGDFDRDGSVNADDFTTIDRAFLTTVNGYVPTAAGPAVPEPLASASLLVAAAFLRRNGRTR